VNAYSVVQTVTTQSGAGTMALDPTHAPGGRPIRRIEASRDRLRCSSSGPESAADRSSRTPRAGGGAHTSGQERVQRRSEAIRTFENAACPSGRKVSNRHLRIRSIAGRFRQTAGLTRVTSSPTRRDGAAECGGARLSGYRTRAAEALPRLRDDGERPESPTRPMRVALRPARAFRQHGAIDRGRREDSAGNHDARSRVPASEEAAP